MTSILSWFIIRDPKAKYYFFHLIIWYNILILGTAFKRFTAFPLMFEYIFFS